MLKQKLFSIMMLFSLGTSTLFVTAPAYAQGTTGSTGNLFSGLVQFIAQRFGLDQNQVKSAVADYRTQNKTNKVQNMQNMEKIRLDKLVSQGKLTSGQEAAIINELASLRTKYGLNGQSLTLEQRRKILQSFQNDLKSWAASQNINLQLIEPGYGMGRGLHRGFGKWNKVSPTP